MKAVVFRDGRAAVTERPDPSPGPRDAVIRVRLAGICGTDLEIARGYLDFDGIAGHEFVGHVERSPEPAWTGRRVVGEINAACGACGQCRAGVPRHCPDRTVLGIAGRDGAFAERVAVPVANLHPVPDAVPDTHAVFAEPLAAAYEILEQIDVGRAGRCVVLGDGRLGQLCALVLARAGVRPVVCGHHSGKLRRLQGHGLETFLEGAGPAREFDWVVEATGSPAGLTRALELVRPRGTIVLKSTYQGSARLSLAEVVIHEVRVVGSRCGPFEPALEHLESEPAVVENMITATFPLGDAEAAFVRANEPDALKVVLSI